MVKRAHKSDDGMYHIKGKKFPILVGSRAQYCMKLLQTTGGLTKTIRKTNTVKLFPVQKATKVRKAKRLHDKDTTRK